MNSVLRLPCSILAPNYHLYFKLRNILGRCIDVPERFTPTFDTSFLLQNNLTEFHTKSTDYFVLKSRL